MVSPSVQKRRDAEAERVDQVFQYVLAQIGASSIEEALLIWQDVPSIQTEATIAEWVARATRVITTQRARSRSLGIAYYRLVRALRTGRTIPNPVLDEPEPEYVSLEALRREFDALLDPGPIESPGGPQIEPERLEELTEAVTEEVADTAEPAPDNEPLDEDDAILLEEIRGLEEAMAAEDEAERGYVEMVVEGMGTDLLTQKVNAIDPSTPVNEAAQTTRKLHLQVGAQAAAASARVAMNGGKSFVEKASTRDGRVIGWVRQSSTGSPCYWCAALISRGVLYKAEATAGGAGFERAIEADDRRPGNQDVHKFHDNCYCIAVPVFSEAQFNESPAYAENRRYRDLWTEHIAGKYSGEDAMRAWRKLLRAIDTTTAAQEAA